MGGRKSTEAWKFIERVRKMGIHWKGDYTKYITRTMEKALWASLKENIERKQTTIYAEHNTNKRRGRKSEDRWKHRKKKQLKSSRMENQIVRINL